MLNFENLDKGIFYGDNAYQIPEIEPLAEEEKARLGDIEWIPFSEANAVKDRKGKGIHFFIDDYRFVRVWNNSSRYINILKEYEYVLTPDFSTYRDMPKALQIYNSYRKQWLGAYWQSFGIKVIPTTTYNYASNYECI